MFDFFKYLDAWEETLKEKKELDILVLCYEDMKKVLVTRKVVRWSLTEETVI